MRSRAWSACGLRPSLRSPPGSTPPVEKFCERVRRVPAALGRWSRECFAVGDSPLRLATLSMSRSVVTAIEAVAPMRPVHVACGEGRPMLEGRAMASHLAAAGIPVTFFSDVALSHALGAVDAVLVGADAVTPH